MYLSSATGHGKGSVDALGGTVKSTVRKRILSKKESIPLVTSAESFVKVASQLITKTKVVYVPTLLSIIMFSRRGGSVYVIAVSP